jgi:hypothetical protein
LAVCETESNSRQYTEFDRWELLAAFQALLVYCLLRLQDVPVGHDGFEAALLTTVNVSQLLSIVRSLLSTTDNRGKLVFNALASSAGGILKMKLPDDLGLSWTDWIYNESRRR